MTKPFQRLSARERGEPVTQVLHEGVPAHLEQPIRAWIYRSLRGGGHALVAVALGITIDHERAEGDGPRFLAFEPQPEDLLDVVDAILPNRGPWPEERPWDTPDRSGWRRDRAALLRDLDLMLAAGFSAYRINDDGDGLERRVDATTTAAFNSATDAAAGQPTTGFAADQIRDAWSELYGITPNAPAAYSAAIKAVESAAHSVIEPNNTKATLGTMIRLLDSTPHKWVLELPGPAGDGDVEVLRKMMELL